MWRSQFNKTASRTSRANSLKVNKHKSYFILVIVWMIVFQSVNIIVWPRPHFEVTQFKMPCGTYDPLLLISRLNTAFETTFHLLSSHHLSSPPSLWYKCKINYSTCSLIIYFKLYFLKVAVLKVFTQQGFKETFFPIFLGMYSCITKDLRKYNKKVISIVRL